MNKISLFVFLSALIFVAKSQVACVAPSSCTGITAYETNCYYVGGQCASVSGCCYCANYWAWGDANPTTSPDWTNKCTGTNCNTAQPYNSALVYLAGTFVLDSTGCCWEASYYASPGQAPGEAYGPFVLHTPQPTAACNPVPPNPTGTSCSNAQTYNSALVYQAGTFVLDSKGCCWEASYYASSGQAPGEEYGPFVQVNPACNAPQTCLNAWNGATVYTTYDLVCETATQQCWQALAQNEGNDPQYIPASATSSQFWTRWGTCSNPTTPNP